MTFSSLNDVIKLAIFFAQSFPGPHFLKMTFLPKGSVLMALFRHFGLIAAALHGSKLTVLSDAALKKLI